MKVFDAPDGNGIIFFENLTAPDGKAIVYDPETWTFSTATTRCANRESISCNWTASQKAKLCRSCAMTKVVPDLSARDALQNWAQAEAAKRWVLDNLGQWGWFTSRDEGPAPIFHMLAEGGRPVVMGHADGVVSINLAEANPIVRTQRREALNERYRTMIGHMRHELAHLLWWRLSVLPEFVEAFRSYFGDEQTDYGAALDAYYKAGPADGWEANFLTPYASAHPHEDWAESVAHLLHLVDITDSYLTTGNSKPIIQDSAWKPYSEQNADKIIDAAASVSLGVNHINRSMGLPDLYPFVLSEPARSKMRFAHAWLSKGPML